MTVAVVVIIAVLLGATGGNVWALVLIAFVVATKVATTTIIATTVWTVVVATG